MFRYIKKFLSNDTTLALLGYDAVMLAICAKIILYHAYTALNISLIAVVLLVNALCILQKITRRK